MYWKLVHSDKKEQIKNFLLKHEKNCVGAAAHYKHWTEADWLTPRQYTAWAGYPAKNQQTELSSLLLLTRTGSVFVMLNHEVAQLSSQALAHLFKNNTVASLQGLAEDVIQTEAAFNRAPASVVNYYLMHLDQAPEAAALAAGPSELMIHQAAVSDLDRLFPLQAAYEIEEVIPPGGVFYETAARLALLKTLKEQQIVYATLGDTIVGKAGTNAHGYVWDQLGGIYVAPSYRGKGIATRLVATLAASLIAGQKKVSLFVKTDNLAAQRCYVKTGFQRGERYRISYFPRA